MRAARQREKTRFYVRSPGRLPAARETTPASGSSLAAAAAAAGCARAQTDGRIGVSYLSPAHRASHSVRGPRYQLEPYVVAGDIYSQPPYVGRGGWSWYTGAAGWLHRAAIEAVCGLQLDASTLQLRPCLPEHWPQVELTVRRAGRCLHFVLLRATASELQPRIDAGAAQLLRPGQPLAWTELAPDATFVVPLLED